MKKKLGGRYTAIHTELVKNLEVARISLRLEAPLIQIIDVPIFPLEKKKVSRLKGLLLGGFLFGKLTLLYLIVFKWIKNNL